MSGSADRDPRNRPLDLRGVAADLRLPLARRGAAYQTSRLVRHSPALGHGSWVVLPIGGTLISNGSALLALGNALWLLLTSPARTPGAQTMRADDQTQH